MDRRGIGGFVVRDSGGQKLAYVYFEEEPGGDQRPSYSTKDEARRIAANVRQVAGPDQTLMRAISSAVGENTFIPPSAMHRLGQFCFVC